MKKDVKVKVQFDVENDELVISNKELERFSNTTKKTSSNIKSFSTDIDDTKEKLLSLALGAGAILTVKEAIDTTVASGFEFNKSLELSVGGIQSLTVATSSNITSTGRLIDITEKYSLAQKEAILTAKELAKINTSTPHTLNETNQIYKAMYVSMKNAGATTKQMINLTEKISIAAGSAGIEFQSLLSGVDGLATGTVEANSDLGRFLSGLGLTNEELKETDNVVELLEERLSQFQGLDTMDRAVSNLDNSWSQLSGNLTEDIFQDAKEYANDLASVLDNINVGLRVFKLNSAPIEAISSLDDLILKQKLLTQENAEFFEKQGTWGRDYSKDIRANNEELDKLRKKIIEVRKAQSEKLVAGGSDDWDEVSKNILETYEDQDEALQDLYNKKDKLQKEDLKKYKKYLEDKKDLWEAQTDGDIEGIDAQFDELDKLYEIKEELTNSALAEIANPIDTVNDKFKEMHDVIKETFNTEQLENFYDKWGDAVAKVGKKNGPLEKFQDFKIDFDITGLNGLAKTIANAGSAIDDINESREGWNKLSKEEQKLDKNKSKHINDQMTGYGNLAGVMSNFFDEGSKGAQTLQAAQTALQMPSLLAGVMNQSTLVYPYNILAMAATFGLGMSMMGGGGSGGGPSISTQQMNENIINAEHNPAIDRMDRQIELLEAIERNGSASAISAKVAARTFERDYALFVNESINELHSSVSSGWAAHAGTNKSRSATEAKLEAKLGFNLANSNGKDAYTLDAKSLAQNYNFMRLVEIANSNLIQDTDWRTFFDKGWTKNTGDPGRESLAKIATFTGEFQELLSEYTLALLDSMDDLKDAKDDFKGFYDDITGSDFYKNQDLQKAFEEVKSLTGSTPFADYLKSEVENIQNLEKFLNDDVINTLLEQDPTKLGEQLDLIQQLEAETGLTFENGAEQALNFLESIELVSETMATSRENMKSWQDSFKTDQELAEDMASKLGVTLANNLDDLGLLFKKLSSDTYGLVDAELELLEANKELIESNEALRDDISASIESTLASIKGTNTSEDYNVIEFNKLRSEIDSYYIDGQLKAGITDTEMSDTYNSMLSFASNIASSNESLQPEIVNYLEDTLSTFDVENEAVKVNREILKSNEELKRITIQQANEIQEMRNDIREMNQRDESRGTA